jgi:hypothetical protein
MVKKMDDGGLYLCRNSAWVNTENLIHIAEATYGGQNVTERVKGNCQLKNTCQIPAETWFFQIGGANQLSIKWSCGSQGTVDVINRSFNTKADLSCGG